MLSLGPHFCYPIPSFDNSTGDGWGLITFIGSTSPKLCVAAVSAYRSKHRPRNNFAKNTMTQQKRLCPYPPPPPCRNFYPPFYPKIYISNTICTIFVGPLQKSSQNTNWHAECIDSKLTPMNPQQLNLRSFLE